MPRLSIISSAKTQSARLFYTALKMILFQQLEVVRPAPRNLFTENVFHSSFKAQTHLISLSGSATEVCKEITV